MNPVRKGEIIEIEVKNMAYGGRGIGRVDGFVIFVRGGIPGDRLRVRIYKKKKDFAEAAPIELISPSPWRVEPPCPYFGYCGGCQWQNVAYEKQLEFKREHVLEPLERIGGLKDVMVQDLIPSDRRFAYRNKMEFSFSDRRWYLPEEMERRKEEGEFALGLHVPGTYHKVIDVDQCLLQHETGNEILRVVKEYVKASGAPVYGLKSHKGFWRFLALRYSAAFDQWLVNLVTSRECLEKVEPLCKLLVSRFRTIRTVVNNINSRRASIALGEREKVLFGEGYIRDRIGPFTFRISANSFFQTNSKGAGRLYETMAAFADLQGFERVLDLYSGTGTIPIFLARGVRSVTGIEISSSATTDAIRNTEENGIENCRFICGDIREKLSQIDFRPDLVVIDPPRAGMHKDVLAETMALSPEKIVYISCNPATLARDLALMRDRYELLQVQPVDMFPHTYHIEAVARLILRGKKTG